MTFNQNHIFFILYLGDVDDFVQLREEPLAGIINLSELLLGDADPRRH